MSNNLTIKDVAKLSGFSVRTVSRVINNEGYVKEETRVKIQEIIKETGFETNIFAKSLRKKIVKNLILVIEKEKEVYPGAFFSSMFQNVINEASKYGYNVFMMEYDIENEKKNRRSIQLLKSNFIDGAIIFTIRENDPKIDIFKKLNLPFVAMSKNQSDDFPYVIIDNYKAAYMAGEYLIEKGCKSFVYIGGSEEIVFNNERKEGFLNSISEKYSNDEHVVLYSNNGSFEDAYMNIKDIKGIKELPCPIGVFVASDEMAFGVLKAFHDNNINIPKEAMVIGFDDIPLARYSIPSLTTIRQDTTKMAEKAVNILNSIIENKTEAIDTKFVFNPEIIERDSTN